MNLPAPGQRPEPRVRYPRGGRSAPAVAVVPRLLASILGGAVWLPGAGALRRRHADQHGRGCAASYPQA